MIIIDGKFSISIDGRGNHTLVETKNGRRYNRGHFRDPTGALKKYIELSILSDPEVKVVRDYIIRYERAVEQLKRV